MKYYNFSIGSGLFFSKNLPQKGLKFRNRIELDRSVKNCKIIEPN